MVVDENARATAVAATTRPSLKTCCPNGVALPVRL